MSDSAEDFRLLGPGEPCDLCRRPQDGSEFRTRICVAVSDPADIGRLFTQLLDVLPTRNYQNELPPAVRRQVLMAHIRAYIRDNLGDAGLTPDVIAAAHHISLRYLHKLFQEEEQTVAGWVRECRLEQCRRDFADPRLAGHPITAIAAKWGFTSPAHFSQAFRSAYGLSPSQFRRNAKVRPD